MKTIGVSCVCKYYFFDFTSSTCSRFSLINRVGGCQVDQINFHSVSYSSNSIFASSATTLTARLSLELPAPLRIERIMRSALHMADDQFYAETVAKLSPTARIGLDALLQTTRSNPDAEEGSGRSALHDLKQGAGAIRVDSLLVEIDKLEKIEKLGLPTDLFLVTDAKVLESYRRRVAVEDLHEIQRHPDPVR
jgi:hypothetical protein